MAVRNRRDGKLKIIDGDDPVNTDEVSFAEGDLTYNTPEQNEPIVIKDRAGALDHVKTADKFSGWGTVSFSFKYVSDNLKSLMTSPETTSAIAGDGIPTDYPTVNVHYEIYDDSDDLLETHKIYNVYFDPGKVTFSEGDEYSTMSAEGTIFGKIDGSDRVFAEVITE